MAGRNLGAYNDTAANGGDVAGGASRVANNSFDAFTAAGTAGALTANNVLEVAALGYGSAPESPEEEEPAHLG